MLWTEYRPVIKIGPKGALGSHEIRPIHSVPSLGQSIVGQFTILELWLWVSSVNEFIHQLVSSEGRFTDKFSA